MDESLPGDQMVVAARVLLPRTGVTCAGGTATRASIEFDELASLEGCPLLTAKIDGSCRAVRQPPASFFDRTSRPAFGTTSNPPLGDRRLSANAVRHDHMHGSSMQRPALATAATADAAAGPGPAPARPTRKGKERRVEQLGQGRSTDCGIPPRGLVLEVPWHRRHRRVTSMALVAPCAWFRSPRCAAGAWR